MSLSTETTPEPSLSSKAPFRDTARAADSEPGEVMPIPLGPLRSQLTMPRNESPRPSFWQRITMRKRAGEAMSSRAAEDTAVRLGAIDLHLEQLTMTLSEGLAAVNQRLSEVWEPEEQLSQLADIQDKLDQLSQNQTKLSQSVADLRRILGWTAGLVIVVAAALGFAFNQLS